MKLHAIFLLRCIIYNPQRILLLNDVNQILIKYNLINIQIDTNLLLYGHDILSKNDNKTILTATIKFISDSSRFT